MIYFKLCYFDCEMIFWRDEMMFGHDENVVKTKVLWKWYIYIIEIYLFYTCL